MVETIIVGGDTFLSMARQLYEDHELSLEEYARVLRNYQKLPEKEKNTVCLIDQQKAIHRIRQYSTLEYSGKQLFNQLGLDYAI